MAESRGSRLPEKLVNDEVVDCLVVGKKCWLKVIDPDPDNTGKQHKDAPIAIFGMRGDVTFAGYQIFGNQTFLVLDRVQGGAGKKATIRPFLVNTSHIIYAGCLNTEEQD
jgi:hypothetical protein